MLVVIPWRDGGCPWRCQALDYTLGWLRPAAEPILADAGGPIFSRADSINAGVPGDLADDDVLVALDGDLVIPWLQLRQAADLALEAPGMVLPYDEVRYLGERRTELVIDGASPWLAEPRWRFQPTEATPLVGGCNVLSGATYRAVGGWPGGFAGWGCEDLAFADACAAVAPIRRVDGPMVHLYHPKTGAYVAEDTLAANAARLTDLRGSR